MVRFKFRVTVGLQTDGGRYTQSANIFWMGVVGCRHGEPELVQVFPAWVPSSMRGQDIEPLKRHATG